MHERTARMIGTKIGVLHENQFSKRSIYNNRFLKIRVDIDIGKPIPPEYFFNKGNAGEVWIQFKIEKLSDLCFTCGMIMHTIGRCKFQTSATVSTSNGISAKVYGPWIRAEHPGSMVFINPDEDVTSRRDKARKGKAIQHAIAFQDGLCHAGAKGGKTMLIEDSVKACSSTDLQAGI